MSRSLLPSLPSISVCRCQINFLKHSADLLGDLCSKSFSYSPLSTGSNPEPFGNRKVTYVSAFSRLTLQEVEGHAAWWERPGPERWAGGRLSEVSRRGPDRLHAFCLGSLFFLLFPLPGLAFFPNLVCKILSIFLGLYLILWEKNFFLDLSTGCQARNRRWFCLHLRAIRNVKVGAVGC